jgi:hypothetical protein
MFENISIAKSGKRPRTQWYISLPSLVKMIAEVSLVIKKHDKGQLHPDLVSPRKPTKKEAKCRNKLKKPLSYPFRDSISGFY